MDRFGASVEARYLQALGRDAEVPEDGYHGEYVAAYAADIVREQGDALAALPPGERVVHLRTEGARRAMDGIRETLARFGVAFDTYVSEATLEERGEIGEASDRLFAAGKVYEADAAPWFRSTDYGDDKDRIVVRSTGGTPTSVRTARTDDKFRRGFGRWSTCGAPMPGDVVRVKGAADVRFDPTGSN
jgi:arginyl-tRNA synthetase